MDARLDPAAAFGIGPGDAHVVRNAGGAARDALRSLVVSQQLLGTREVLVVKHTECGMLTFGNADARALVAANLGPAAADLLRGLDFLPFADPDAEVRADVAFLAASPAIPDHVALSGWVYEVATGRVRKVV